MDIDIDETIRRATEKLRQRQAQLHEMRDKVRESRITVRSADGMITVVVDGRGELSSIAFNTAKFRRMAPAQLGAELVKTINKAREDSRDELMRAFGSVMPQGLGPVASRDGRFDIDQIFDDAVRRGAEMLADEGSATAAPQSADSRKGNANE